MIAKSLHVINGATATASSAWVDIQGARSVNLICKRSDHSSGNTVFSAQVAAEQDGSGAVAYSKFIDNVTNTNGQQLTRVASKTLSSNSTALLSMSPEDCGGFIMITATETTDGTHDAWLLITY